jgi:hypothetical protein
MSNIDWLRKRQPERTKRFAQFYARGNDDLSEHLPGGLVANYAFNEP